MVYKHNHLRANIILEVNVGFSSALRVMKWLIGNKHNRIRKDRVIRLNIWLSCSLWNEQRKVVQQERVLSRLVQAKRTWML